MKLHHQDFRHDQSEYERPSHGWVCGWAQDGQACRIGPDRRGRCRATFECKPLRKGDRWTCSRSQAAGGKCPEGPVPDGCCSRPIPTCQPVRSVRALRGFVTKSAAALTVGVVLLFAGPALNAVRDRIISPGPLSNAHAAIRDCATCHPSTDGSEDDERRGSLQARIGASAQCLDCHRTSGDRSLSPHGIGRAALDAIGERMAAERARNFSPSVLVAGLAPRVPANARGEVSCNVCHQEHRGNDETGTSLDGLRCQACHRVKFPSLTRGHPDFSDYPVYVSADDSFEHGDHAEYEDNCAACHFPDDSRNKILTRDYRAACADCHDDDMVDEYPTPARRHVPDPGERLTYFDHGPHLSTPCRDCHAFGTTSDIAPVTKSMCVTCHARGSVTTRCLTCHVYHSESWGLEAPPRS